jgi:predicted kinase
MNKIFNYNPKRKTVILIVGLAGTGKTVVAKSLAEKINDSVFLDSDFFIIKHPLFIKSKDKGSVKLSNKLHFLKLKKIKSLLKNKKIVITDATFYDERIRRLYYNFLKKININLIIVMLKSSDEFVKKRIFNDPRSIEMGEAKGRYEYYLKRKSSYNLLKEPHKVIINNKSLEDCISRVYNYLIVTLF